MRNIKINVDPSHTSLVIRPLILACKKLLGTRPEAMSYRSRRYMFAASVFTVYALWSVGAVSPPKRDQEKSIGTTRTSPGSFNIYLCELVTGLLEGEKI